MSDDKLIDFIEQVSGGSHLRVEENLGEGFVRLRIEEAERRQAKHDIRCIEDTVIELLRNARDAHAHSIYIASQKEGEERRLTVIDDGDGIPAELQELVFDARVTSKLETMVEDDWGIHGRGMALFSIRSNTDEARIVSSAPGLGSAFRVAASTAHLGEKVDQSSFPVLELGESGELQVARGPRNILRTAIEFALANRGAIHVYLGSNSEIAATLLEMSQRAVSADTLLFVDDPETLPVAQRLAMATDAAEFIRIASSIGLDISERTAHRVLAGQISPQSDLLSQAKKSRYRHKKADIFKDSRGLKLASEDVQAFSREMEKAFELLAARYYISLTDLPKVQIKGDVITVRFPIEKD
ncbi:MAG: ATP-binding protein [Coriobacteriia bacterium]|nr:ATP-binding protein [Coriobacteriia bacterium]